MNSWNPFKYPPRAVIKAVWGFFLPGFGILLNAFTEAQSDPTDPVTGLDYVIALLTAVVTGYTVFAAQNTPPGEVTPKEAEGGYAAGLGLLFVVVGIVLIIIGILALLHVLSISLTVSILLIVIGLLMVVFGRAGTPVP